MWACVREMFKCDWNPARAGELITLSQRLSGRSRRIDWICFNVLCWTLWNVIKNTTENIFISQPTNCNFKMVIYLQKWRLLSKRGDKQAIQDVKAVVRSLYSSLWQS
jgi:hypothetical protein